MYLNCLDSPSEMSIEFLQISKYKLDTFNRTLTTKQLQNSNELINGAYVIQTELSQLREHRGDKQIGYKVGCNSETIQRDLGIHHPIFGRLYASECWKSDTTLPLSQFDGLAIEGELAVRLSRSIVELHDQMFDPDEVIQAIFPVIELHHFAFDEPPTASDLIARNAIHAGFVCGKETQGNNHFPEQISIKINEVEVARVSGSVISQTVTSSLRWLAKALQKQGLEVGSNQIILCGSVAPLFPLFQGGHVEVSTDTNIIVKCAIQA